MTDNSQIFTMDKFLELAPPNTATVVSDLFTSGLNGTTIQIRAPEIQLYCNSDQCKGYRMFRTIDEVFNKIQKEERSFALKYQCSNCRSNQKRYAAVIESKKLSADGNIVIKFGEIPPFTPPTPSKLMSLVGSDQELFLKGRRCENQGLGIGAFTYYRRVVENQKNRFISELIKIISKVNPNDEIIPELEAAKKEMQFSSAVQDIKHGLPEMLKIKGHNPLILLHKALSEGLHNDTDEECLKLASTVRVVLLGFAERLALAIKEETELNDAIKQLTNKK